MDFITELVFSSSCHPGHAACPALDAQEYMIQSTKSLLRAKESLLKEI